MLSWVGGWKAKTVLVLVFLLIGLNVLDGCFTAYHVANGYSEANPLVNAFIQHLGVGPGLFLVKLWVLPCAGVLWYGSTRSPYEGSRLIARSGLGLVCSLYGLVLAYHLSILAGT